LQPEESKSKRKDSTKCENHIGNKNTKPRRQKTRQDDKGKNTKTRRTRQEDKDDKVHLCAQPFTKVNGSISTFGRERNKDKNPTMKRT
jgi:hypothetical protein